MAYGYGTVKTKKGPLNVRSAPNVRAEKIGSIPNGEEVILIQEYQGWWAIEYEDEEAYVSADYIVVQQYPDEDNNDYDYDDEEQDDNQEEDWDDDDDDEDDDSSTGELNLYRYQQDLLDIYENLKIQIKRLKDMAYELG